VVLHHELKQKIINTMLEQVQKERNGEDMDRIVMQKVVVMMDEIDEPENKTLYDTQFEAPFLMNTKDFYNKESL
jgi:hypothetical protein